MSNHGLAIAAIVISIVGIIIAIGIGVLATIPDWIELIAKVSKTS
jgi:hypothetical protein